MRIPAIGATPPATVPVVLVTPELAQQWLDTRLPNERTLRQGRVEGMARDMKDGNFFFIGDPIRFDGGHLVDGQHRLQAVVLSGVPQHFIVLNIPTEAQHVIDTGAKRTVADMLRKKGIFSSAVKGNLATAIANKAQFWELGYVGSRGSFRTTADESLGFIERNKGLLEEAVEVGILVIKYRLPVAASSIATMWFLTHPLDADQADLFWRESVIRGVNIDEGDPAYALRDRFQSFVKANRRINPDEALLYAAVAWNHHRLGNQIVKLQAPRGGFTNKAIRLR